MHMIMCSAMAILICYEQYTKQQALSHTGLPLQIFVARLASKLFSKAETQNLEQKAYM